MSSLARKVDRRRRERFPGGRFIAELLPLPHPVAPPARTACATCGGVWSARRSPAAAVAGTFARGAGFNGLVCGSCTEQPRLELHEKIAAALREFLGADDVRVAVAATGGRA